MSDFPKDGLPFGRYKLLSLLGEGGMAEVFLAELRAAGDISKILVIKRVLPHLVRDQGFVSMFFDEARLASKLTHPNVVQVFDFGEVEGQYYLAMEYLPGESLHSILFQAAALACQVPLPVVLQTVMAICDGLHYAHELTDGGGRLQIVHRDVTPSNIMVSYQGNVKLLDFGVARAADRQQEKTRTGVVKGKPAYCAPEQLEGGEIDRRSDIFALGVVCHEMLTLQRLFKRDTDLQTMHAVLHDPIPRPEDLRADLPRGLGDVVLKAVERERDRRYATARDFRKALEQYASGAPAHLDEYMIELFGQARAQAAIERTLSKIFFTEDLRRDSEPGVGQATARMGSAAANASPITKVVENTASRVADKGAARLQQPAAQESATAPAKASARVVVVMAATVLALVVLAIAGGAWLFGGPRTGTQNDTTAAATKGTLHVDTLPRGAKIEVGDKALADLSPVSVVGLAAGDWVVRASLDGYQTATTTVTLQLGAERSVVLGLERMATLKLVAPKRAQVEIDAQASGESRVFQLTPGTHEVKVTLGGYDAFVKYVTLKAGEELQLSAQLRLAGTPSKKSEPIGTGLLDVACVPWCRVFIDGTDVGRTSPIVGLTIEAGRHVVRMDHPPSGKHQEAVVQVAPGERVRQRAEF
jgi:serine/threonine protein kinase